MTAEALVVQCQSLGVTLGISPEGKLRAKPPGRLPQDLKRELVKRKAEIIPLLRAWVVPWPCPSCGGKVQLDPVEPTILPTRFWTCPSCEAYGVTREGAALPVAWMTTRTIQ